MPVPLALLMLLPGLPSLLDLAKIFGAPVALYLLARFITRRDKTRDEAAALVTKNGQETATERRLWREGVIVSIKSNTTDIAKEHADRIFWQLENAADWERVVSILKEFGEVQRQLAVVASTSSHHSAEIQRLNAQITEMNKHLNDFIMRHVRPASA